MRTLLPDPPPAELQALLERRKRLGQDRKDEVWEGVLHMVPGPAGEHAVLGAQVKRLLAAPAAAAGLIVTDDFNVGEGKNDFRVPDGGLHRSQPRGVWISTAALALEILSPDDETWQKLPFYATHHVDEILILDPDTHQVHWLALTAADRYEPIEHSALVDLGPAELAQQIDWP
ncbi:MAG: Uma2 family endonuclease [Solirubrobacteraceae bacterium]